MTAPFDAEAAFLEAFDAEMAAYPEDTVWQVSGRPSKANPNGEDSGWWKEQGPIMVRRWIDWRKATPWPIWIAPGGALAVELQMVVKFAEQEIKLVIDNVFATGPGNTLPLIVDKKSGARPPDDDAQLGLYKAAMDVTWPEAGVIGGAYWNARTGELTNVTPLREYTPEYFAALARRLREIRKVGAYLPRVGSHCRTCKVGQFCAINRGAKAYLDPDYALLGGR